LSLIAPSVADDPAIREFWADCEQQSSSPSQAMALSRIAETVDVRTLLTDVQAPTLVIVSDGDRMVSPEHSRYLSMHIPHARLVEIPAIDHMPLWECGDVLADEVETFVAGPASGARADRRLAAVMFADIVGSTERARAVGDRRWRRSLDDFERVSSEEISRLRGRLVKNTGDGVLAIFDSASNAIAAAVAISVAVRTIGLKTHAGVNVGDVELRGEDVGGTTVNIAARVADAAGDGEVLVTTAACESAGASGIRFASAGTHTLKGVDEPRQLYRVEA
jgi:class 3 adenylate cyclase